MDSIEMQFETKRLAETVLLAQAQLERTRRANEDNKSAVIEAKREMRENVPQSAGNLWSSDGFEALAALSQYVNPISNKITEVEAGENKIIQLERLIKSPYFARIDFKYDDEDDFEQIYIGRSSLLKEGSYEMCVYDWRSPIASVFYRFVTGRAFYDAPMGTIEGELALKRQYEINNSVLEYFFDCDVQIIDEFLRNLLSKNTSPKMKAIVETIQREQDIIIRDMENDLMMVQGAAGSGKTSVALHRAACLMYQGMSERLSSGSIMIISPTAIFERYISNVLPELGEENVTTSVLEEILERLLGKSENHLQSLKIQPRNLFLETLMTSSSGESLMKRSIEFKTSPEFMEILNRFADDIPRKWLAFEDVRCKQMLVCSKEAQRKKVVSGRENTPLSAKLALLNEFVTEAAREASKQYGGNEEFVKVKNYLNTLQEINVRRLYEILFSNGQYFKRIAEGISLPDCIDDIISSTRENLSQNQIFYDDAPALAYLRLKTHGASESHAYKSIKHVLIDEAQDYYPLHYEIIGKAFSGAKFTVLGDFNQTFEKQEDLSLYERISSILNKKKTSLVTLDKSFRCTKEILSFSSKFLPAGTEIKSFSREGEPPEIYVSQDFDGHCSAIVSHIHSLETDGYQSIGLICKTEKNSVKLYEALKKRLNIKLIRNEAGDDDLRGIFIIPVYLSKGLEFDAVLLCDANAENYCGDEDKKLLYVACTRALHRLSLFACGEKSPLLQL